MSSRKRSLLELAWNDTCIDELTSKTLTLLLHNRNVIISKNHKRKCDMIAHLKKECNVNIAPQRMKLFTVKSIMAELKLKKLSTQSAAKQQLIDRYLDSVDDEHQQQQPPKKKQRTFTKCEQKLRRIWGKQAFKWPEIYNGNQSKTKLCKKYIASNKEKLKKSWWNDKNLINEMRSKYVNGQIGDGDAKYFQFYHIRPVKYVNKLKFCQLSSSSSSMQQHFDGIFDKDSLISVIDFDVISANMEEIECRLEFGEIDCSYFGQLSHRITGEILAKINEFDEENFDNLIGCNTEVLEEYDENTYSTDIENDFDQTYDSGVYIAHNNLDKACFDGMRFVIVGDLNERKVCKLIDKNGGNVVKRVNAKTNYLIVGKEGEKSKNYKNAQKFADIKIIQESDLKDIVKNEKSEYCLKKDCFLKDVMYENEYEFERIVNVAMNLEHEIVENPQFFACYWPMALRIDFCESKLLNVIKEIVEKNEDILVDVLKKMPGIVWKCVAHFAPVDLPCFTL